jgi:hypothetical protein
MTPSWSGSPARTASELSRSDDTGVQVSLFEDEMGVTVPYWHTGEAARAVMRLVWSYLAILDHETGWETYDPQLGRGLDRARDREMVSGRHADMSAQLPGLLRGDGS